MKEVSRSLMALFLFASACGNSDPLDGDAIPDKGEDRNPATARDGGSTKPGSNGGKDGGTGSTGANTRKDASSGSNNCGRSTFATGSVIPDMMILLDRSGSMQPGDDIDLDIDCKGVNPTNIFDLPRVAACAAAGINCNDPQDAMTTACGGSVRPGPVDRWTPSVSALKSLTARFDKDVSFGLMTFPSRTVDCGAGDELVPMGLGVAAQISTKLDQTRPSGGTPTGPTLEKALQRFKDTEIIGDAVQPARYVLLVTDGQPTCPHSRGNSNNRESLEKDKQLTIQAIDELSAYGVKTFVVGYDAQLDQTFAQSLSEFAQHGGTDDYFPVQNETSLIEAFEKISESIVTCNFEFKSPIDDPRLLRVTLDGVLLRPDDPNGWVVNGQTITIQGSSCEALMDDSTRHGIEIVLECEPVVYI
jgi:uncharacterized protein YegL